MRAHLACLSAMLLGACGETGAVSGDAGPDASPPADDGGLAAPDAGADGGPRPDGGGSAAADGGAVDGGSPGGADAGPVDCGIVRNCGFEDWSGGRPDHWGGVQTNLPDGDAAAFTAAAHGGSRSLQLTNPGDTHKRYTTQPTSARAGRYECAYHVRGRGEIRTGRYDTDFSSYTPSGYHAIDTGDWVRQTFSFSLAQDVADTFELILSFRNTAIDRAHLQLDDFSCVRTPEPCDAVACEAWQACANATATCRPLPGRCDAATDCAAWQACDAGHRCVPAPGRCAETADCAATASTPVCDVSAHACTPGDPCAGVTCTAPESCVPATGRCGLAPGRCRVTTDCTGALPACDRATGTCVGADDPANLVPNGGFERWSDYAVPYHGTHLLPDDWYGLDVPGSSEIDPADVRRLDSGAHGGQHALQLVMAGLADRFTSEAFDIPAGDWSCSYRARGHGGLRHRSYSSGGWSVFTERFDLDTDEWQMVPFQAPGNVRDFRLIFYASHTQPDRGHVQIDDVVCTRR